jgi:methionyl-tRNA formyltransferase
MYLETFPLRIGYFGDGKWSHKALDLLLSDTKIEICFICCRYKQPDRILWQKGKENKIDVFTSANINSPEFLEKLKRYEVDLFVSMSFDQVFRRDLYTMPKLRTINCHAGRLPDYKGRNVLNWVLINDEDNFGITVHYIDDNVDTGDIICQGVYPITDQDDYGTLLEKAYAECPKILYRAISKIMKGEVTVKRQDDIRRYPILCSRRMVGDERIDWKQSSREIFNFVRALTRPGPCAKGYINGECVEIIKVEYLPIAPKYKGIPGSILQNDGVSFTVKTMDSYVKVCEWNSINKIRVGERFS